MQERMFTTRQFEACADHAVAFCEPCHRDYRFSELAYAALVPQPFYRCPRCRTDVTDSLALHAQRCQSFGRRRGSGLPSGLR